jgi:hypothetical protein
MTNPTDKSPEMLKTCSLLGCTKEAKYNDCYCSMHRARLSRTGRFDKKTAVEKLKERTSIDSNGCWNYTAYKNDLGYGRLRSNGKQVLAHRLSYESFHGALPKELLVCHKCDNPSCVNPDHLFLGTNTDNIRDSINKGRRDCVKIAKERWKKCPTYKKK